MFIYPGIIASAEGQKTLIKVPAGSAIESVTVTPLTYTHLNGTWNIVSGGSKGKGTLGTITFGTEELKCNWCKGSEKVYGFTGIFSGQHVTGKYVYILPGPNADLDLDYTYHHHKVEVGSNVNTISPNHMEMIDMTIYGNSPLVGGFDYKIATGLYIHSSKDIIHLTRLVSLKTLVPLGTASEKKTEPIGVGVGDDEKLTVKP